MLTKAQSEVAEVLSGKPSICRSCRYAIQPDIKRVYERLVARGKHAKVAIVAAMRKLIVLANALIRDDRIWTPKSA
ncbi:hypothetical protein ACELLULO517_28265 [Acidisoma cellulosilytica]|uniref:Transposase n=1 Tax=Acidisoma cellulosilyticum TaxID=2802395 RepID=A0A963Z8P1_9PROT|nr:hypothetical protein [Acidisoma cellulosilyticum]MCB8884135.1 hypothetical protein [Acidisoma cellulosilyticum]